jgi:pimeloyl-ACP methyl ester carboxylesterase
MTTFVLVHGAWHGGWCWRRVADRLRAAGHDVYTPTLTGLGESSHLLNPTINLQTHIRDIVGLLRWEELNDVVICGHSYGGMVLAGAIDIEHKRIKAAVYLDALVPEKSGQSATDLRGGSRNAEALAAIRTKGKGWMIPPTSAKHFGVNEADQAWVDEKCTPLPAGCFTQPVTLTGAWLNVPHKSYIRAGGYAAPQFDQAMERLAGDESWQVSSFPCGHDIMVDMPAELSEALIKAGN